MRVGFEHLFQIVVENVVHRAVMGIPPVPIPKHEKIQLLMYDSQLQTWIKAQLHDELHSEVQFDIEAQLHDELHSQLQTEIKAQLHDELQPEKIQLLMYVENVVQLLF